MTNQEIYELMTRFDSSSLTQMKLTRKDFSIELSRGASCVAAPGTDIPGSATSPAQTVAPAGSYISAPLVGTFYTAPSPDAPPFIAVGDRVQKGQKVCLIEAMKMMSEITAPCDCIIEELLQSSGTLVSFDAPLIRYKEV